jgi:hypothetical protein
MLGDPERERKIAPLGVRWCALGHDLELHVVDHRVVA